MLKTTFLSLLVFITLFAAFSANTRAKRAINPFLDSMGKRAVNPFMDSIGKRMNSFEPILYYQKRYFDSLAGQSLGKRSIHVIDA